MDHRLSDVQKAAVAAGIQLAYWLDDLHDDTWDDEARYVLAKIDEILSAPEVSVPEAAAERMQRASLSRSHD